MKRKSIRSKQVMATVLVALLLSVLPAGGASMSMRARHGQRDRTRITYANTAEVKATAGPNGVLIEWRTAFELDNLGFNIYRDQDGARSLVNSAIIAGSALIAGPGTPLYAGYSYRWFDAAGTLDSRYYLEDLDLKGVKNLSGPFAPVWNKTLPNIQTAETINEVAAARESATTQLGGPAGTLEQSPVAPASIQDQWAIVSQPGLKIGVKQDGWYRVTQAEMNAAGFAPTEAANLRLFVDGREVPMEVSGTSGPLNAGDYIEFYGTGLDTPTTDTHIYYLVNGTQAGLRIPLFGEIHDDVALPAAVRPAPLKQPSDNARIISNGGWFGNVSSGVVAEKENRKTENATAAQTDTGLPSSRTGPASNVEDKNLSHPPRQEIRPDSTAVKDVPPEVVIIKEEPRKTPPRARATSRTAPRLQSRNRTRRQIFKNRRKHRFVSRRRNHAPAVAATAGFLYDVQRKDRFIYFSSLQNGPAENFFGGSLQPPPYTQNGPTTKILNVKNLQTDSQGTALLRIGLQGTSSQSHLVNVLVNDVMVGSFSYAFQQYAEQTFQLPASQLREGDNTLKFLVSGGGGDLSLFSYARLTYPRTYRADSDTLSFTLRSTQSAKISGFTTPDVRVLDISDPNSIKEVRPVLEGTGADFSVGVPAAEAKGKGTRTYLALPSNSYRHPVSLLLNQASVLNQAGNLDNSADLLIIAHQSFISSLTSVLPGTTTSLVALRQSQGLTVKVVDIEDVFDEFSYGMHTSQAITDFLSHARGSWIKAPRYLLIMGDASYDPRNYEGGGSFDLVPTKLIDTSFLETGSDDTLTDFDGDGIPEIPVGRLPVRTVAEGNIALAKIVNFSPANVPQTALMVADAQGSYYFNFEQADDQISALLPPGMTVQKVYRRLQPSDAAARANIISKINAGAALVNYSGHGNVDVWTGAPIFSGSDAMALTNGNKLPLVIVMDCLNGYFIAPPIDCIGESLMKAPNGGAVASFASSGLTIPDGQHQMGQRLFQALYGGSSVALGDATRLAKAATTDLDVRRSWILFGDPSMKIR